MVRGQMVRRFQTTRAAVALACVAVMYVTAQTVVMHWSWRLVMHACAAALLVITAIEQYPAGRMTRTARPMALVDDEPAAVPHDRG